MASIPNYELAGAQGFVVEIYMPERRKYRSGVQKLLESYLRFGGLRPYVEGYSTYRVRGAFKGKAGRIYREPTTVIRIFFDERSLTDPDREYGDRRAEGLSALLVKIKGILNDLALISFGKEEELWIMRVQTHLYRLVLKPRRGEP